jgi:hypothetical protein
MLLHEMIHAWLFSKGVDAGHGPDFKTKAAEVGSKFGATIPLVHDVDVATSSINSPPKLVGVLVWGPASRRAFTLFRWAAVSKFVTQAFVGSWPWSVSIYKVKTTLANVFTVKANFSGRLTGNGFDAKFADLLTPDLNDSNLVCTVSPEEREGLNTPETAPIAHERIASILNKLDAPEFVPRARRKEEIPPDLLAKMADWKLSRGKRSR